MTEFQILKRTALLLVLSLTLGAGSAFAATDYDLTFVGASATINGAIYQQWDGQPTGTGIFGTFVEIGQPGGSIDVEHAYNTTVNGVLNNGSSDQHNYSITLGDLGFQTINGVLYAGFALDVNEDSGNPNNPGNFLSLDDVQIFVGGTANSSVTTFTGGVLDHDGTLVYRMDGLEDSWVALDYALNSGSGSGDMLLYVAAKVFDGFSTSDVITLYSHFGGQGDLIPPGYTGAFGQSDGFEEWAYLSGAPIPEPTAALLFGTGLLVVGASLRRR